MSIAKREIRIKSNAVFMVASYSEERVVRGETLRRGDLIVTGAWETGW